MVPRWWGNGDFETGRIFFFQGPMCDHFVPPGWLFLYWGWNTAQLNGDYFYSHEIRILIKQLMECHKGFDSCSIGFSPIFHPKVNDEFLLYFCWSLPEMCWLSSFSSFFLVPRLAKKLRSHQCNFAKCPCNQCCGCSWLLTGWCCSSFAGRNIMSWSHAGRHVIGSQPDSRECKI